MNIEDLKNVNLYLFTLGRLSPDWGIAINDGLVTGSDSSTWGKEAPLETRIARLDVLDDDGYAIKQIIVFEDNVYDYDDLECDEPEDLNHDMPFQKLLDSLKTVMLWVLKDVRNALIIQDDADYCFDNENVEWALGEGGELNLSDEEAFRGALVLSVLPYYSVSCEIVPGERYGVVIPQSGASDEHEFCGVICSPTKEALDRELQEADEYSNDYENSIALYADMVEKWKSLNLEQVSTAWNRGLEGLKKDTYFSAITSIVNLSVMLSGDSVDARRLLDEYEKRADIGFYSEATASAYCEAASLYNHIFPSNAEKERVYALIEKAAHAARLDSEDDIITVIECVGGEYQGAHQGDTETAQRLLDEFLAKIEDKKLKAKFKKKAEKALNDLS